MSCLIKSKDCLIDGIIAEKDLNWTPSFSQKPSMNELGVSWLLWDPIFESLFVFLSCLILVSVFYPIFFYLMYKFRCGIPCLPHPPIQSFQLDDATITQKKKKKRKKKGDG